MDRKCINLMLLSAVLSLGACTDVTGPAGQLEVTVSASAAVASIEEPALIEVSALNRGDEPVLIRMNPCPGPYRVTNSRGRVVAPGPTPCQLIVVTEMLDPGERLVFSSSWAGTTRERVDALPVELPPGRYAVRGLVLAEGAEVNSAPIHIAVGR